MHMESNVARKKLFDYLPAIFQEPEWRPTEESTCPICHETVKVTPENGSPEKEHRSHLCEFLEAFEKVLFGFEEKDSRSAKGAHPRNLDRVKGLGQKIEWLHELFDPYRAPEKFLPWLASWAAFVDRGPVDRRPVDRGRVGGIHRRREARHPLRAPEAAQSRLYRGR